MKKINRDTLKRIHASLAAGLCCSMIFGLAKFDSACEDLRNNCLRLHVLANSDSNYDQSLKLFVRDAVLEESEALFTSSNSLGEAMTAARENLDEIGAAAQQACYDYGGDYKVTVSLEKEYFETREYEDFTLPAGEYEAVRILIGAAKGHNWWCVMYPCVCLGSAGNGSIKKAAGSKASAVAKGGSKYKMKFKIVEIYQDTKRRLSGK